MGTVTSLKGVVILNGFFWSTHFLIGGGENTLKVLNIKGIFHFIKFFQAIAERTVEENLSKMGHQVSTGVFFSNHLGGLHTFEKPLKPCSGNQGKCSLRGLEPERYRGVSEKKSFPMKIRQLYLYFEWSCCEEVHS